MWTIILWISPSAIVVLNDEHQRNWLKETSWSLHATIYTAEALLDMSGDYSHNPRLNIQFAQSLILRIPIVGEYLHYLGRPRHYLSISSVPSPRTWPRYGPADAGWGCQWSVPILAGSVYTRITKQGTENRYRETLTWAMGRHSGSRHWPRTESYWQH